MPTFLVFKGGKKVEELEVRGADVRRLRGVVEGCVGELKAQEKVVEEKAAQAKVADEKRKPAEETKVNGEVEEKTVSGSYGMSSNNNWKMSLH
jgi:thioredoxin 1